MSTASLHAAQRADHLASMTDPRGVDVLVIGGGVTGAGIALDAATRGLSTAIVEAQDWASGTSSRSSRLVHGGLRYLYNLDFKLVAEALHERGLLLTKLAPHLVKAQPLLWPFRQPVIERGYSTLGVGLYDAMALVGSKFNAAVPIQRHLSKKAAMANSPSLDPASLVGAMVYHDARVDDARLVITLVRTAVANGALAASRVSVVRLTTDAAGRVTGAVVRDNESGLESEIRAKHVIGATGVWTEQTQDLAGASGGLRVLASKGIHILVPRERIRSRTGMFLRTEKSVLFIIPWPRYWLIGTTDTAWHEQLRHPVPTSRDIDYLLDQANRVLADKLTREDVIGTYAGLRPLLQPGTLGDGSQSTKVSREHTVTEAAPGLTMIAGGKLTTYRVMAKDAVDFALGRDEARKRPSITHEVPLLGADGYAASMARGGTFGQRYGWTDAKFAELLERYGSGINDFCAALAADASLNRPLEGAPAYLRGEVAWGVIHEGAMHLEDMLVNRVRVNAERPDRGLAVVDEVAAIMGELLGWSEVQTAEEKASYRARVAAELAAQDAADDSAASRARLESDDLRPM